MKNNKTKIAFHTFGCKLNFSETSSIARSFDPDEYEDVKFKEFADIYVIHSCTVTANAEKKCKNMIRQARKRNPQAIIAVMGCYAQLRAGELAKEGLSDILLGNVEKYRLAEFVNQAANRQQPLIESHNINTTKSFTPSYSIQDRTRSFFKIQDGCDYFCTYCAIPLARGRSRSNTIAETLKVAREIANTNIREVILTGVNIGDFGQGTDENFFGLLQSLDQIPGIERYRIGSIEPELLTDEIIDLVHQSNHILPHFHIPLQSGSDKILKLMKRKYRRQLFADRVHRIKSIMPQACIAADVIIGFPGETEEDFTDTIQFIKSLPISYLHVFTYSERPNTLAIKMPNPVPEAIKHDRSKRLHLLSDQKKALFYEQNKGTQHRVLLEGDITSGKMHGFTDNYIRVRTPYNKELINQIRQVTLDDFGDDFVFDITLHNEPLS